MFFFRTHSVKNCFFKFCLTVFWTRIIGFSTEFEQKCTLPQQLIFWFSGWTRFTVLIAIQVRVIQNVCAIFNPQYRVVKRPPYPVVKTIQPPCGNLWTTISKSCKQVGQGTKRSVKRRKDESIAHFIKFLLVLSHTVWQGLHSVLTTEFIEYFCGLKINSFWKKLLIGSTQLINWLSSLCVLKL